MFSCPQSHLCSGKTTTKSPKLIKTIERRCRSKTCKTCRMSWLNPDVVSGAGRPRVKLPGFHVNQKNVVYSLFCTQCARVVYVGSTRQSLKQRLSSHYAAPSRAFRKHVTQHAFDGFRVLIVEAYTAGLGMDKCLRER